MWILSTAKASSDLQHLGIYWASSNKIVTATGKRVKIDLQSVTELNDELVHKFLVLEHTHVLHSQLAGLQVLIDTPVFSELLDDLFLNGCLFCDAMDILFGGPTWKHLFWGMYDLSSDEFSHSPDRHS